MKKAQYFLVFILLLIFVSACGTSEAELAQTEEAINGTIMAESTGTAEVKQTEAAITQEYESQMAETAQAVTATEQAIATATSEMATQQVEAQLGQIGIGQITTANGYFEDFPAWSGSYANQWSYTLEPLWDTFATDFVMVLDITWEIEDSKTDWAAAGCGIAFRISEDFDDYYTYFLTVEDQINFFQVGPTGGRKYTSRWADVDPMQGSTTIIITVEGIDFKAFNENFELKDQRNGQALVDGSFAYMIVSGSNNAPGTQCSFTNVDLWHLEN